MTKSPPPRRTKPAVRDTRTKSNNQNPFDTTAIAAPWAEKALIANLLPAFSASATEADVADARRIVGSVSAEMLVDPCAAAAFAAFAEAIAATPPTMADVSQAARRLSADDAGAKPTMHYIVTVGNSATSWHAAGRLADEAAAEIRDAHLRRITVRALETALQATVNEAASTHELDAVIHQVSRVRDAVQGRANEGRRLRVRNAAEVEPRPIEWLWPGRISQGSLTLIMGLPGVSKSTLTYDIAARITRGTKWPDHAGSAPRGGIILFGMEDDVETVVIPRLMAAGADLDMIRIVDGAEDGRTGRDDTWLSPVSIERDLALVREQLDLFPECKAVILDPLSQFVEAEENSNAQTRAALAPLVALAQSRGVTIIGISHMSKKTDSAMIQRIAGASSYAQMARHVLFVGNDPNDDSTKPDRRRVMLVVKSSYGRHNVGQLYRVTTRSGDQPGIEWIAGTVEFDAEALNPRPPGVSQEYQERRGEAVDALRDLLAGGPRPGVQVETELEQQGFRRRQIDYATKTLGVEKRQTKSEDGRRSWVWSLPAAAGLPAPHDAIPLDSWSAW